MRLRSLFQQGGRWRERLVVLTLAALGAGCATVPPEPSALTDGEPVYRIVQPPHSFSPLNARARILLHRGHHEEALRLFNAALTDKPDDVSVLGGKALAAWALGDHVEALASFHEAARLAPLDAAVQNNLGYALFQSGEHEAGWQALRRAFALNPRHPGTRANLRALAQRWRDQCGEARACRGTIGPPSTDPSPDADAHDASPAPQYRPVEDFQDTLH